MSDYADQGFVERADQQGAVLVGAVIVDELIRAGVREAVVCPGSRSAPLALALAEADRAKRLRLHVRTDERTGAYLALGLAKASGCPVPIVMTSGTAVANCLPAMVEATASGVPLMVLSANRPYALLGTGANQTIDQAEIFGAHSVHTVSTGSSAVAVGEADGGDVSSLESDAVLQLRAVIRRAVLAALDPATGGGVHVDVPLQEPLVPAELSGLSLLALELSQQPHLPDQFAQQPHLPDQPAQQPASIDGARRGEVTVDLQQRTLVVVGSVSDERWARAMCDELADIPTIAEPTGPKPDFPIHPAAAVLFSSGLVAQGEFSAMTKPEHIVVVGRPTLHRSVAALLADESIALTVLSDRAQPPTFGRPDAQVGSRVRVLNESPDQWLRVCQGISDLGVEATRSALSLRREESAGRHAAADEAVFSAVHAMALVADCLADGDALVLGASSTIRDAAFAGLPFDGVRAFANRGASGIDGTVSTAVGVALSHAASDPIAVRAPRTVAVMGDLTFLHDVNGLNIGPGEPVPSNLLLVVINDQGGGIFETLEPGQSQLREFADGTAAFERVFATPTHADIGALVRGFGHEHRVAYSVEELAGLIEEHAELGAEGILVVEAQVDRAWRANIHEHIQRMVKPKR